MIHTFLGSFFFFVLNDKLKVFEQREGIYYCDNIIMHGIIANEKMWEVYFVLSHMGANKIRFPIACPIRMLYATKETQRTFDGCLYVCVRLVMSCDGGLCLIFFINTAN